MSINFNHVTNEITASTGSVDIRVSAPLISNSIINSTFYPSAQNTITCVLQTDTNVVTLSSGTTAGWIPGMVLQPDYTNPSKPGRFNLAIKILEVKEIISATQFTVFNNPTVAGSVDLYGEELGGGHTSYFGVGPLGQFESGFEGSKGSAKYGSVAHLAFISGIEGIALQAGADYFVDHDGHIASPGIMERVPSQILVYPSSIRFNVGYTVNNHHEPPWTSGGNAYMNLADNGSFFVVGTKPSVSPDTGAFVVSNGGAGIAQDLYVGGDIDIGGAIYKNGVEFVAGIARTDLSVTDNGGAGSLSYNNTTGVFTYTGPSAYDVRVQLSAGTGISYSNVTGVISLNDDYGDTKNPYASKTANHVLAAPNGSNGVPTFRALVASDIPTLNQNTTGSAASLSATLAVASGGTGQTTYTDGQLLIGNSTGNTLTKATLTAGTGITITNGAGSITIASTGGTVTSVSGTGTVNGLTLTGTVTASGNLTLGGTLSGIANSALTNSSITINGTSVALGGTRTINLADLGTVTITSPSNGQVLKYDGTAWVNGTDSTGSGGGIALTDLSVTDSGGDGSLSYNNTTGVFTYTGPSATEVRSHFTAGTGISISSGVISATGGGGGGLTAAQAFARNLILG